MPRRRIWKDRVVNLTLVTASDGIPIRLTGATTPDPEDSKGMTMVRCLGRLNILPLSPGTANGRTRLFVGLGIVSEEAFVAAGASLPTLDSQQEQPSSGWLLRTEVVVVDSIIASDLAAIPLEFDIRSQRKLMYGVPYLATQNVALGATPFTVSVTGVVRTLFLMP